MKNIFDEVVMRVDCGEKFKVDFKTRKLKVGKEVIIDKGIVADGYEFNAPSNPLEEIESAYDGFYYSRPSERSEKNRHSYFKAMRYEEMSDEQLILGKPREVERAKLELTVLLSIIGGWKWEESYGKWYWKSKKYPTLVLLKEWIEEE